MIDRRQILRMHALASRLDGEARAAVLAACDRLLHELDARPAADDRVRPAPADRERAAELADRLAHQVWVDGRLAIDADEQATLRALDPQQAARLLETALAQWPAAARQGAALGAPPWLMANALLHLASLLPPDLPLAVGAVLRREAVVRAMPRSLLAWTLARAGAGRLAGWAAGQLATQASRLDDRAMWLHDIVMQIDAPPPFEGAPPVAAAAIEVAQDWADADFEADAFDAGTGVGADAGAAPARRRRRRSGAARHQSASGPPSTGYTERAAGPAPAEFHFVLEGEGAHGATMREHSEADLHFRYDLPPADALARVHHPALESARQADLDISLQLTACGAVSIEGDRRRVATLRNGRLRAPVSFRLRAGAAPDASELGSETHGVHVDFVVSGVSVHQLMLAIAVLPASGRGGQAADASGSGPHSMPVGAGPILFDAALAASPPAHHHVRLSLSFVAGGLHVEMDHVMAGVEQLSDLTDLPQLDRAALAAMAQLVRAPLARCYAVQAPAWQAFDGSIGADDAALHGALGHALECVASCGSALNRALRQDPGMARILDYVESLPAGTAMTITTDDILLPWELLTTQHWSLNLSQAQRAAAGRVDTGRFWGTRFAIETKPRGVPVGRRQQVHGSAVPRRVSVNLNPEIKMPGLSAGKQPLEVHQAWARQLADKGQLDGRVRADCLGMREVLQDGQHQASLVYVYCHGRSSNPFGGIDELLELDNDCALSPSDLVQPEPVPQGAVPGLGPDPAYGVASLVFLNACQSGQVSPLGYSSFLKEFCKRGAIGLIATTHAVPITFGAHFGPELVGRYLDGEGPLAEMLRQLRGEHLERGNPVPLFYTLQAQLVLTAGSSTGDAP